MRIAGRPAILNGDIAALDLAGSSEALPKGGQFIREQIRRTKAE